MASGQVHWGPASVENTTSSLTMIFQKKGKVFCFVFLISYKKNLDDKFSFRPSLSILCFIMVIFIIDRLPLLNYSKLTRWSSFNRTQGHKMPLLFWCHTLEWSPVAVNLAHLFSTFGTNTIHHNISTKEK